MSGPVGTGGLRSDDASLIATRDNVGGAFPFPQKVTRAEWMGKRHLLKYPTWGPGLLTRLKSRKPLLLRLRRPHAYAAQVVKSRLRPVHLFVLYRDVAEPGGIKPCQVVILLVGA